MRNEPDSHWMLATTTETVRRAIQHSQESLTAPAQRYGINQKTVAKWTQRASVADLPTGPREPTSTVLSVEEEAIIIAFCRHTLLPLDDCLYAVQATIPHLTRSSLHRCLQRHGISRLPEVEGDKEPKRRFQSYPIGFFHTTLPRCTWKRADCACMSARTEPRNLPSPNSSKRPHGHDTGLPRRAGGCHSLQHYDGHDQFRARLDSFIAPYKFARASRP